MKAETKAKLQSAYDDCVKENRSFAYILEYLQDVCDVDFDCASKFVMNQLEKKPKK